MGSYELEVSRRLDSLGETLGPLFGIAVLPILLVAWFLLVSWWLLKRFWSAFSR